jgi:hypothetical protein
MFDLEKQVRLWRHHIQSRGTMHEADVEELENHLKDQIDELKTRGLSDEEAFLIGVKRLGRADTLSKEFSKVNTENLWKQLMIVPQHRTFKEIGFIIVLCLLGGTLAKVPELFGYHISKGSEIFYFKNLSFFILPFISIYFIWKSSTRPGPAVWTILVFLISAILVNSYPSFKPFHNAILTGIHLPILLWLMAGLAYTGTNWKNEEARMDFIRFTGETFIYTVLILCGLGVLIAFVNTIFSSIGIDTMKINREYLMVYGGVASPVIAVYLVQAKKAIIENLAPVLAKIFSPLFLLTMLSFLFVMIVLGKSPYMERDFLIGFDIMLVLVLGLVLYEISARPDQDKPGLFDYLNLSLIIIALIIDAIALSAIIFRLSAFGATPNKVAALGENIILLINLVGLAVLNIRFMAGKTGFRALEGFQTRYLPVYAIWAGIVVFLFPVIFGFH